MIMNCKGLSREGETIRQFAFKARDKRTKKDRLCSFWSKLRHGQTME